MQRVCLKSIKSEKESAIYCFVNVLYSQTRHGEAVTTAQNIELGESLIQINCHMSCSLLLNGLVMFMQKTSAFLFHSVALMIICHLNLALRVPIGIFTTCPKKEPVMLIGIGVLRYCRVPFLLPNHIKAPKLKAHYYFIALTIELFLCHVLF